MSKKSYREAINEAIASEMRRDPRVIVMGEDNAGGAGAPGEKDAWGGVLGVTKGLQPEVRRATACSIRRSPKAPSSARRPARRRPACARSPN